MKSRKTGSNSLYYDEEELGNMTPMEIVRRTAENSNGFTMPGWEPARLAELERVMELYKSVDAAKLRENFKYFLDGIIPTCEEVGVRMACIRMIRAGDLWSAAHHA